jgi:myo-inositol catabolism protein IolC
MFALAFDHRGVFRRELFGIDGEPTPDEDAALAAAKEVIYAGIAEALDSGEVEPGAAAILVDERHGAAIAHRARARGVRVAMPVERADRDLFEFEYGDDFKAHIERFQPDYAKVLVRFNPEGNPGDNDLQLSRLRRLAAFLEDSPTQLMFELIVVPSQAQLAAVGRDARRFDVELRPHLIARSIAAVQAAGVEPAMWKLEGVDSAEHAQTIAATARAGPTRANVGCILLGAGAPAERVREWLQVAAATPGYRGFAIGRSVWGEPLRYWLAGEADRSSASAAIAERYLGFIRAYRGAVPTG